MKYLQTWEPFKDLWTLHGDIDKLFFGPRRRHGKEGEEEGMVMWTPAVDIYEGKEDVKVYVDLPGINKKDVTIHMENNVLTLKGERKFENEEKKENYTRVERYYGTFRRSFTLPDNVDATKIKANMKDGTLTITIPKNEEVKPKEIEIAVN